MRKYFSYVILLLLGLTVVYSCKLSFDEPITWDTDILAPIAYSEVKIEDIIQDSTLFSTDNQGNILIAITDTLVRYELKDFLVIPDTVVRRNFDLETFRLDDQNISNSITLGVIARQLAESGNPAGGLIPQFHGGSLPIPISLNNLSFGPIAIDASDLFEKANVTEGTLNLSIVNRLPIPINNLQFEVVNREDREEVISGFFSVIAADDSATSSFDLGGKIIESNLDINVINMDISAPAGTPIDTTDALFLRLSVEGLMASEATAIFPSQRVLESTAPLVYRFSDELEDLELTFMKIKTGEVSATVFSTIEDSIEFFYSIPSATLNGQIPEITSRLDPAPVGAVSTYTETQSLAGYEMDLLYQDTLVNALGQEYSVDLVYSGKLVSINLEDSVYLDFSLLELTPSYLQGYFGRRIYQFKGSSELDMFDELSQASILLDNPVANLRFSNGLGVEMQLTVDQLTGVNSITNRQSSLTGSPLSNIEIAGPVLPDTFGIESSEVQLSTSNSNIKDFASILPDKINYQLAIDFNTNGVSGLYNNFATDQSAIYAIMDLEIPLSGSVSGLSLTDTADAEFGEVDIENVNEATFRILIDNGFPVSAKVTALLYDDNWRLIDILAQDAIVDAAPIGNDGYSNGETRSIVEKKTSNSLLNDILLNSSHLILQYNVESQPAQTSIKLRDSDMLRGSLVTIFNYELNR